jgi:GNAT superfamily N-acetyltransferase
MTITSLADGYELDDDLARVDIEAAHAYLGGESYWAKGRAFEVTEAVIRGAGRIVGLYAPDGAMVGFARATTDFHTFAYLGDVYVLEAHRGRGLGVELVRHMIEGSSFPHVRWLLGTLDAHTLYEKLDFGPPSGRIMERRRRDPVTGAPREMGS